MAEPDSGRARRPVRVSPRTYAFAVALRQLTRLRALPLRLRLRLARLFFRHEEQSGFRYTVMHRGIRWAGDFQDYIDWRIYFLDNFERESIDLCEHLAGMTSGAFVDVGTNKGLYAGILSRSFGQILAFEPAPQNLAHLRHTIARNRLTNVEVRATALGDEEGEADFHLPPDSNRGQGSLLPITHSSGMTSVRVTLGDREIGKTAVGLVKIDVEGFEAKVLRGMREVLRRDRPFILFEIGDSSRALFSDAGGVHAVLPEGYELFEVSDRGKGRRFSLISLADDQILGRPISNNLACPREKIELLLSHIEAD